MVTISGTPTASGSFTYTVTTTGGCTTPAVTASGTITINTPPVTTGYSICQGLSVPAGQGLTSSASCAASIPGTAGLILPEPAQQAVEAGLVGLILQDM